MSYLPNESATGIDSCSTMFWPIANSAASVSTTHWRRPQLKLTAMTIQRRSESKYAKRAALWRRAAGAQPSRADNMGTDVRRSPGHFGVVAELAARLPTFVGDRTDVSAVVVKRYPGRTRIRRITQANGPGRTTRCCGHAGASSDWASPENVE